MTRDDATRLTLWIGDLFPEINEARAKEIRDSIEPLTVDAVERAVSELTTVSKWFDLPRVLRRVRELAPQQCGGPTADEIQQRLGREAKLRLAHAKALRQAADASFDQLRSLPDDELQALADAALARADPFLQRRLAGKPPRQSPTLLGLIAGVLNPSATPTEARA